MDFDKFTTYFFKIFGSIVLISVVVLLCIMFVFIFNSISEKNNLANQEYKDANHRRELFLKNDAKLIKEHAIENGYLIEVK